ncbi:MAG: nucleotidyltransferase family protein [Anaerolineaceae bacterium]|nr:nucleotidyltransferase family protein [Anaerolineaceae bacterium]
MDEEINSVIFDLAYLVGCAVDGVIPDAERVSRMDLDAVYQEAGRHMLSAAAAMALESAGMRDDRSSRIISLSVRKTSLFDRERKAILEKFEENGIWYMPLKGILIKELYPKYGMREMCDNDILVDAGRLNDIRDIMLALGFTEGEKGMIHDSYFKNPLNFEIHKALFKQAKNGKFDGYFDNVKEFLIKDENNQCGWHFSTEDFYAYILAHANRHISGGGTGIRSLLDIYVISAKLHPDRNKVLPVLEKTGLTEFESDMKLLSQDLFRGNQLTAQEMELLRYVETSGAYGTISHRVENRIREAGGGKSGKRHYIFRRLFPSMERIKEGKPFFYRHKILLPFLLPYRLGRGLLKHRTRLISEFKALLKL